MTGGTAQYMTRKNYVERVLGVCMSFLLFNTTKKAISPRHKPQRSNQMSDTSKANKDATHGSDVPPCSRVFPISTLRDIFNLPTFGQMETCLRELSEGMIQARLTNDVMVATMQEAGADVKQAVIWPEVINWTDDGEGDVTTLYGGPDGDAMFSLTSKVSSENV